MPDLDRVHLAQVLHDGIAQDLVALGYGLDQLLAAPNSDPKHRAQLRTLRFSVDDLIQKVRDELFELRAPLNASLGQAIRDSIIEMGIEAEVYVDIAEVALENKSQLAIFEIAVELLRNAKKHSRASRIELTLTQFENRMYLRVFDNGLGGAAVKPGHFGLVGIKEKIDSMQGEFKLDSHEEGTTALVVL